MSQPVRIRARLDGSSAEITVLMPHPMETGLRQDATGAPLPAHYITDLHITLDGRPVLDARLSIAVSRDPLLSLRCKDAKAGDRVVVAWTDNLGERRVDETRVA
jgi:sulfur-oxidizing protein SoxZ